MTTMTTKSEFQHQFDNLLMDMRYRSAIVPMNFWQSKHVAETPGMRHSRELQHVSFRMNVPGTVARLQAEVQPNLPWAEDHFLERVSGEPLNPPPSEAWWPYRVQGNQAHKEVGDEKFSHTYPERMWPKMANVGEVRPNGRQVYVPHNGIRYEYGDLIDLVNLLTRDPLTRQAYLPIWFPEDTGAVDGQRVPCTLGYHFLFRPAEKVRADASTILAGDIVYYIRSCDLFRHFTDDVYMAARLLQWVVGMLRERGIDAIASSLVMHITSLHIFEGDEFRLKQLTDKIFEDEEGSYGAPV